MQRSNNYPFTYFKRKIKQSEGEKQATKMKLRETSQCSEQLLVNLDNGVNTINNTGFSIVHESMKRFLPDRVDDEHFLGIKSKNYFICNSELEQLQSRNIALRNMNYEFMVKSDRRHTLGTDRRHNAETDRPSSWHARVSPNANGITRHYSPIGCFSLNDAPAIGGERSRSQSWKPLTSKTTKKWEHLWSPRPTRSPGPALPSPLRPCAQRGSCMTTRLMMGLLLLFPVLATTVGQRHSGSTYNDEVVVSGYSEVAAAPYFLSPGNRNITTTHGQTGYLHCRVASLGDMAQVSWIRKRDLHVLSSGRLVFASDQRFQVINTDDKSENWTLQIKFAQLRDSGIYECQVNTVPKISMAYQLNVVESEAVIHGPEYVKAGSTISLTCTIHKAHMEGGLVFWYHNTDMLKYEDEGNVNILTKEDQTGITTSQLTIRGAQLSHSGNYTCWPTLAKPKAVIVNVVLQGEQPAAMQTGVANQHHASTAAQFLSIAFVWVVELLLRGSLTQHCLSGFSPISRPVIVTPR